MAPTSVAANIPQHWIGAPFDPELARDELLHELFEAQADARPEAVAVEAGGERLSYGEVERRANQLANVLRGRGVQRGGRVAILLPRGNDVMLALLAILKSGAAYVPIDPDFPPDRVSYIIADAGARFVISTAAIAARHELADRHVIRIDADRRDIAESPWHRPARSLGTMPSDLCYIIYTSGSTGRPKGVEIEHRSACNLVRAEGRIFSVRPDDRVYQGFSIAFDASVEEIWLAFFAGAALVVATEDMVRAGQGLGRMLADAGITVLSCVPTLLAMMESEIPSLRLLIVGGEACPADIVRRWARRGRRMVNTYGPTEATVIATWGDLHPDEPVTIGRPAPNYRVYLLDSELRPVEPGAPGELFIGGAGVARGYVGRADLTAERFITNPLTGDASDRLYRTGDLGRYLPDGRIGFVGRSDAQVKIRGFRIELPEIESALLECPQVLAAAATVRLDGSGAQQLVAYVVPRPDARAQTRRLEGAIKPRLRARLPAYMVPARIEVLDQLPHLPSGKIDRSSLPAPRPRLDNAESETDAAISPFQSIVLRYWRQLLAPLAVTLDDDFFLDLGGHSLLAATLVSRLRAESAFAGISMADLYNHPTVRLLAAEFEARDRTRRAHHPEPRSCDQRPAEPAANLEVRYRLCGAAQLFGLYFVLAFFSVQWLSPYLTYSWLVERGHSAGAAILASVSCLLLLYPLMIAASIAAKWTLLGRVRPGRYPLWGWFYFRWWLASQIQGIAPVDSMIGTPLMNWYCRLMGAKVGSNVVIATDAMGAYDMLAIGDESSIGAESTLLGYHVEAGVLTIGRIAIGRRCYVGTRSVLAPDTAMANDSKLEDLSLLPAGGRIPGGERWLGSPARPLPREVFEIASSQGAKPRPGRSLANGALYALGVFVFPLVYLSAVFPGMLLMNHLSLRYGGWRYMLASPLVAVMFIVLLSLEIAAIKWLLLGKVRGGSYPVHGSLYRRKWFVDRLMALSRDVLGPLYATLYLAPWYRLLGAKMGRGAEVSTACEISPDLLDLQEQSFVADAVSLGAARYEKGRMTLAPVRIGRRAFIGNSAAVAAGTSVGDGSLVGVLSAPPRSAAASQPDTSWLGSPAILLPRRQPSSCVAEQGTFEPTRSLVAQRLAVEFARVTLPATCMVVLSSVMIAAADFLHGRVSLPALVLFFPMLYLACAASAALFVVAAKWLLMGRYVPGQKPLWSGFVWRTELLTALHEHLANPFLVEMLTGTPFASTFFRLMGAGIGRHVFMETTCLTEFDLIRVGDNACLNVDCTLQTHLFEDRVMKMSRIDIGAGCTVGQQAVVLYDSTMEPGATLSELSLLMKGESLPAGTRWEGSPARRVVQD